MTTTDIDLDTLPSDTLVAESGRITPIGKLVIAQLAKELADICSQADDPQAAPTGRKVAEEFSGN